MRMKSTPTDEQVRKSIVKIEELTIQRDAHRDLVYAIRQLCEHDWLGLDDVHPHGTPCETFVCKVCGEEETR